MKMKCDFCGRWAIWFYKNPHFTRQHRKTCEIHGSKWLHNLFPLTEEEYTTLIIEEKINGPNN